MERLKFDAIDSLIIPRTDTLNCLRTTANCCSISGTGLTGTGCTFTKRPSEECVAAIGGSFFEFDTHSETSLNSPPTLTLIVMF